MGYTLKHYLKSLKKHVPLDGDHDQTNVAMELMSNERTLLSWFRTAFAMVALGVLVIRITIQTSNFTRIMGIIVIILGILLLLVGISRYIVVRTYVLDRKIPVGSKSILLTAVITVLAFIALCILRLVT